MEVVVEVIGQSGLYVSYRSRSHHWFPPAVRVRAGDLCFINSVIRLQPSLCVCVCRVCLFVLCLLACREADGRLLLIRETASGRIWERRAEWARKSEVSPVSFLMQTPSSLALSYSLLPNRRGGLQAEQADRSLISKMMVTKPSLPPSLSLSLQPHHVFHRYEPNHSLAKQWHTQHLAFLSFPSFSPPVSLSCHHLCYPLLRLLASPPPSVSFMRWLWVE